MKPFQKAQFFQQLATMSRGGMSLSQALETLAVNTSLPVVGALRRGIEEGKSLELVFDLPEFTDFERSFIGAGYQTGQLAASFAALGDFWQRETDLAKALKQAMTYPIFLVHFAVLVGWITLVVESPFTYLIAVGLTLGGLYAGYFLLSGWVRRIWRSPGGQARLLIMPLIGPFWKSVYRLRWIQIVGMEFNAGIGLPYAVADAWRGTGAAGAEPWAVEAKQELSSGASLSELVGRWRLIPPDWKGYLVAGENAGQLGDSLRFLSEESEKDYARRRALVQEWVPKLGFFVVALAIGVQVVLFYVHYFQQVNQLTNPL